MFDYPVVGEGGDPEGALCAIEAWCAETGTPLVLSVVPEDKAAPCWRCAIPASVSPTSGGGRTTSTTRRSWPASPGGVTAASATTSINSAGTTPTRSSRPSPTRRTRGWPPFGRTTRRSSTRPAPLAVKELELAKEMFSRIGTGWFCAGGMMAEGRLVAVCLAEKCGGTLVNHIEKALYSHAGAYPALVQAFAAYYGQDCLWCNREDDARDKGLRTSKLQYLPEALAGKVRMEVGTELTPEDRPHPQDGAADPDAPAQGRYSRLQRPVSGRRAQPLVGLRLPRRSGDKPLTDTYFYDVARADFAARRAVNFAVRLKGRLIGEVVLYRPDFRGGFEQGCRIAPDYAGHGYGTEAFAAAADWALYHLGLARVVAKCFKENEPSRRMLASCMRPSGRTRRTSILKKPYNKSTSAHTRHGGAFYAV